MESIAKGKGQSITLSPGGASGGGSFVVEPKKRSTGAAETRSVSGESAQGLSPPPWLGQEMHKHRRGTRKGRKGRVCWRRLTRAQRGLFEVLELGLCWNGAGTSLPHTGRGAAKAAAPGRAWAGKGRDEPTHPELGFLERSRARGASGLSRSHLKVHQNPADAEVFSYPRKDRSWDLRATKS